MFACVSMSVSLCYVSRSLLFLLHFPPLLHHYRMLRINLKAASFHAFVVIFRNGEGLRETEIDRERDFERETGTHTHIHTDSERERKKDSERQRGGERKGEKGHTQTERERERERERKGE